MGLLREKVDADIPRLGMDDCVLPITRLACVNAGGNADLVHAWRFMDVACDSEIWLVYLDHLSHGLGANVCFHIREIELGIERGIVDKQDRESF
jgi:hypothetical protein